MEIKEVAVKCLRDEADAILHLIDHIDENFDKAVRLMLECPGKVIVTGVGKSGHIATKMAATLSSTGTPSFYVNPLDVFHGDLGVITHDDVVVAFSNSGHTDELLRFVPILVERGIPLIALTGNPDSLLAQYSNAHINVAVSREACPLNLAPTSSTTAALAMADALACALMEERHFQSTDFARFHPGGSLGRRLLTKAQDVMRSTDMPVIPPSMPLGEAIIHVSRGKLGLGIVTEDDKVTGLITDGDVRRAMESLKEKFFNVPVSHVMTRTPKLVSPTTKINEIQGIMSRHKIHSVLVVDEERHLLGVVDHFSCMI